MLLLQSFCSDIHSAMVALASAVLLQAAAQRRRSVDITEIMIMETDVTSSSLLIALIPQMLQITLTNLKSFDDQSKKL